MLHLDALNALDRTAEVCVAARKLASGPLGARDADAGRQFQGLVRDCERREAGARAQPNAAPRDGARPGAR